MIARDETNLTIALRPLAITIAGEKGERFEECLNVLVECAKTLQSAIASEDGAPKRAQISERLRSAKSNAVALLEDLNRLVRYLDAAAIDEGYFNDVDLRKRLGDLITRAERMEERLTPKGKSGKSKAGGARRAWPLGTHVSAKTVCVMIVKEMQDLVGPRKLKLDETADRLWNACTGALGRDGEEQPAWRKFAKHAASPEHRELRGRIRRLLSRSLLWGRLTKYYDKAPLHQNQPKNTCD